MLRTVDPRRVVEIGALQGETTEKLLDLLGPEAELHVIDPVPQFDPSEHERRFPGRYHFHRDISHNVLPTLPAVDAALIDGDHNWYTVYHELKMLAASADEANAPLPLLFLHDVGWPYGRRDLYYEPERIPAEFRQPYACKGLEPGHAALVDSRGLNREHSNAITEGGRRNGVRTALDDFLSEHPGGLRVVVVPVQFGLAIVADLKLLSRRALLASALDRLETAQGRYEQAQLAESLRLAKVAEAQTASARVTARLDRGAERYLDVVKAALLDEHYLENEVRIAYLRRCLKNGIQPEPAKLRDPRLELRRELKQLQQTRRSGTPLRTLGNRPIFPYAAIGRTGLDRIHECLKTIRAQSIPGDIAACGVWRGGSAIFIRAFLEAHEMAHPNVWVIDSFSGPPPSVRNPKLDAKRFQNLVADLTLVRDGFARFGLLDQRVRFLQGSPSDTLVDAPIHELALLHLGDEYEETTTAALDHLYDRLAPGGFVIVAHYDAPGCQRAVHEFRRRRGIEDPLNRVDWSAAFWRKSNSRVDEATVDLAASRQLNRAPLPARRSGQRADLSVVAVFHDMRREALRTLHSLSRAYQQDVDDLDYEVIVVENGSSAEQALGEEFVRGFGSEFRYLDLGENSTPSPAHALNRGIEVAQGDAMALMIDGAHVVTPGLLHFGMLGLRAYAPAVVTAHQFYLGPGQQDQAIERGYDREYEDRLFEQIGWPTNGYRLFEIGNFIGDRDWFDGLWESNCLLVPRELVEQVGGADETFSMPGGGYANLDLFERLAGTPGVTVVGALGEGSFHQLHGGTTTNAANAEDRHALLMSYREHYEHVRGRPFQGPGKPRHFVGKLTGPALRTRPRWMTPQAFRQSAAVGADGPSDAPTPVPDELRSEYTEAFWRSLAWKDVTWLGSPIERSPGDLVAYQLLISRLEPEWIVQIGGADRSGALFLASICELVGSGRVLCVRADSDRVPTHPRITRIAGDPTDRETRRAVFEAIGDCRNVLVVVTPAPQPEVVARFETYAPLVTPDSYLIVEGTILNGHPVMPEFGPGPSEAVRAILRGRSDFVPDHGLERFGVTFNPFGFLKRVG